MKSFKTQLKLNNKQKTMCAKHAGVSRHAWNWGLSVCNEIYKLGDKRPSAIDLHKLLVREVKPKYKWYYESSKCSPQQALRNLDTAFKMAFKVHGRGLPVFKKKGIKDSFYLEGSLKVTGKYIKLPVIGKVKCFEELPDVRIKNVVISKRADEWYIAFKFEDKVMPITNTGGIVGVDVGIKTLASLSDGKFFENPKAYKRYKTKLKKFQRKLSKQILYSKNYSKTKSKLSKLHKKISDIRSDSTHKLTTYLAKNHSKIVIEDLNVGGMLKNHKLSSAIADAGFFEFKRQLTYKCNWYGATLQVVDRWFPSSKICSSCGEKKEKLSLKDRVFNCNSCSFSCDRDLNAAINLKNMAVSSTVSAFGETKVHEETQVSLVELGIKHQLAIAKFG